MSFLRQRRGQGLSTNAIILIILGVVVLAVLILGFTVGWSKINPFLGNSNNVDEIVQSCQVACTTNSQFEFCRGDRTFEVDGQDPLPSGSCEDFATDSQYELYGVQSCPSITCP